jgi:hypothetical protein
MGEEKQVCVGDELVLCSSPSAPGLWGVRDIMTQVEFIMCEYGVYCFAKYEGNELAAHQADVQTRL